MTTEALQTRDEQSLVPADVTPMDLQSALAGDLKRLTPEGRLKFYGALCQMTGLNPLSKPFDWLELQGKLVLYANKGCAEQLRKIHGVSVEIIERKVEHGCLIVRVKATSKDGRHDEALGAVPFNDRNPADAANAMMKVETKAKRRVTLSICGLGLLDESEMDTVRPSAVAEVMNGEESAAARADKINAGLTETEKAEAVTVDTAPLEAAPVREANPEPTPEPAPEPTPTAPPANGTLTSDEVARLEVALGACPQPKRAVEYITYRGWLPAGATLERCQRSAFVNITTKTPAFVRMVEGWKGQL